MNRKIILSALLLTSLGMSAKKGDIRLNKADQILVNREVLNNIRFKYNQVLYNKIMSLYKRYHRNPTMALTLAEMLAMWHRVNASVFGVKSIVLPSSTPKRSVRLTGENQAELLDHLNERIFKASVAFFYKKIAFLLNKIRRTPKYRNDVEAKKDLQAMQEAAMKIQMSAQKAYDTIIKKVPAANRKNVLNRARQFHNTITELGRPGTIKEKEVDKALEELERSKR